MKNCPYTALSFQLQMATYAIIIEAFSLKVVLVLLGLYGNGVHSHVYPGLQLRMSETGLDVMMDMLYEEAQKTQISDRNGSTSVFTGTLNYELTNVHVSTTN